MREASEVIRDHAAIVKIRARCLDRKTVGGVPSPVLEKSSEKRRGRLLQKEKIPLVGAELNDLISLGARVAMLEVSS